MLMLAVVKSDGILSKVLITCIDLMFRPPKTHPFVTVSLPKKERKRSLQPCDFSQYGW